MCVCRMGTIKTTVVLGRLDMATTYRASEGTTKLARTIRREGKILERFDKEDTKGYHSGFFIEWSGFEWLVKMLNGEVIRLRKLWEIEA